MQAARAPRRALAGAALALAAALGGLAATPAHATRYCDAQGKLDAEQKDKIFRFGAVIKHELEKSGARLALMARSGLDLSRFQVRYSHAGVSLRASPDTPWAVRQLYFACDQNKPLIFDQGLAAFLMGTDEPGEGYVSVVLLPPQAAAELEQAALDKRQALQLLGATYSANAYPFALTYQNCNQWVMELLASAWGGPALRQDVATGVATGIAVDVGEGAAADAAPGNGGDPMHTRAQAQGWLRQQGYVPAVFEVGSRPLMWLSVFVPWLHRDDHPSQDIDAQRFHVSMPASIEAFVQARYPDATRIEFCHNSRQVVVHTGWQPIAAGCQAGPDDRVIALD